MNFRSLLLSFTGLLLAVSLSACSSESTGPSDTVQSDNMSESEYADFIRTNIPEISDVDDDTIVEHAESTCGALDRGATMDDLVSASYSLPADVAGGLIGGAVAWKCPEYSDIF